jgi:hypothetical protein
MGAQGIQGIPGPVGPTGPSGLIGPTGPTIALTTKSISSGVMDRPRAGALVALSGDCDPGQVPIGGGITNIISDPRDEPRTHLLDSGPTANGWHSNATVISTFTNGSTLEVVLTFTCMEMP